MHSQVSPALSNPIDQEASRDHWPIILVEFINLLGLFLIHTRNTKSARATTVLFDQLVRHLNLLEKLPDQDGAMIIRRIREHKKKYDSPNYLILFGNITLRGNSAWDEAQYGQNRISQFGSALQKAFGALNEQGIHAIFLKLPEQSDEHIEQLRLALNIIARFRQAAKSATPITFRYFGRTLTIPLIRDQNGKGDINLTLMAGLNNLSAANTMEIIKQADAYNRLGSFDHQASKTVNWYNQIFCEPRLRRHLIWPLVEVNNLPWADPVTDYAEEVITLRDVVSEADDDTMTSSTPPEASFKISHETVDRAFLQEHFKGADEKIISAIDTLFTEDYPVLNPHQLGTRLSVISHVVDALEARSDDPDIIEALMAYLNARLKWIPDSVLLSLHTQKKGLRIGGGNNDMLVGMVHPRLLDLVDLIKERLDSRLKIKAVQFFTLGFRQNEAGDLAKHFDLSASDAENIVDQLQACFDSQGRFHPDQFESRIDQVKPCKTGVFEILWNLFKQTAGRKERECLLQAIQLMFKQLDDAEHPLKILISDIFQNPFEVKHMDRNAIVLTNGLLHGQFHASQIDINQPSKAFPEDQQKVHPQVLKYVKSRLDLEKARIKTKLRTICALLHQPYEQNDQGQRLLYDHSFLASLESEICVLLSSIGGETARNILREALNRYSRLLQDSIGIQQNGESGKRPALFKSMVVDQMVNMIRALGRIGRPSDMNTLEQLESWMRQREDGGKNDEAVSDYLPGLIKELSCAIKAIQDGKE
jgi:hypothetical protein